MSQPQSEDHFDNWIEPWDNSSMRRNKWHEVKNASAVRHYEQVNLYRMAIDNHKLRGDLKQAIIKTNGWLERNNLIGYPDSPVNVFINFFKKEVRQDKTMDKAIRGNSVNLDYSKGFVSGLSFYDTYWPTYAMGFFKELSTSAKEIDFEALRLVEDSSTQRIELGASIKEVMAPGLSKLLSYKF